MSPRVGAWLLAVLSGQMPVGILPPALAPLPPLLPCNSWIVEENQQRMYRHSGCPGVLRRARKATGSHLSDSSGCSLFRGPYSMSPPHSPVHTRQPPSPLPLDPKDPRAFPGCSGQMGQSPLLLPVTHQPPLRPGIVGSIYFVANCRLCGLI